MKGATEFIHEMGNLKRVRRSGWWLLGKKDAESVSEHSHRTAAIGYLLAKLEGADSGKVLAMCVFHDLPEARMNDLHKLGQRYIDYKPQEKVCFKEQVEGLPEGIGNELEGLFLECHDDGSKEGLLARDADLLECAFQAKEYMEQGYDASDWLLNTESLLRSGSAKKIFSQLKQSSPNDWWKGKKRIER